MSQHTSLTTSKHRHAPMSPIRPLVRRDMRPAIRAPRYRHRSRTARALPWRPLPIRLLKQPQPQTLMVVQALVFVLAGRRPVVSRQRMWVRIRVRVRRAATRDVTLRRMRLRLRRGAGRRLPRIRLGMVVARRRSLRTMPSGRERRPDRVRLRRANGVVIGCAPMRGRGDRWHRAAVAVVCGRMCGRVGEDRRGMWRRFVWCGGRCKVRGLGLRGLLWGRRHEEVEFGQWGRRCRRAVHIPELGDAAVVREAQRGNVLRLIGTR